jgi:hypothetical protein
MDGNKPKNQLKGYYRLGISATQKPIESPKKNSVGWKPIKVEPEISIGVWRKDGGLEHKKKKHAQIDGKKHRIQRGKVWSIIEKGGQIGGFI